MKRFLIFICMFFVFSLSYSQTTKQQRVRQTAREAYAKAFQRIKQFGEETNINHHLHIDMNRMYGGSGMQNYKMDFYYEPTKYPNETDGYEWQPFFIRAKYNHAVFITTEEYVLNPETLQPVFVFVTSNEAYGKEDIKDFDKNETRIYFDENGLFSFGTTIDKRADNSTITTIDLSKNDADNIKDKIKKLKKIFAVTVNEVEY